MNRNLLLSLTVGLLVLAGCDSVVSPPSPEASATADASPVSVTDGTVTLNGHTVTVARSFSGQATTFSYTVMSVEPGPPALDWLFLENACEQRDPALSPSNAVKADQVDGISGFKWTASLQPGQSRTYSYTFQGDVEARITRMVIQRGGVSETAVLPGPCGGHFIRGSVFVNADANPDRSGTELGIANVLVEVYAGQTRVASASTLAGGQYEFLLPSGDYTVGIPTTGSGAFNATLYGSYVPTSGVAPFQRTITLAADLGGQDFGFNPNKQKIVSDLSVGGAFQTRAQDVKFWQGAIRNAQRGRSTSDPYGGTITPEALVGYLANIFFVPGETAGSYYLLSDPYTQSGSDPLAAAVDLLSKPTKTDVEKVSRNLFAMQLNLMRGWGTPDRTYDDALMSYLEDWVLAQTGGAGISATSTRISAFGPGGGGGGTVEEQMTLAYLGGGGGGTVE